MPGSATEIQQILQTLESLQHRVAEIATETAAPEHVPSLEPAPEIPVKSPADTPSQAAAPGEQAEALALLRDGLKALDRVSSVKDVPKYFARISREIGLRLMLLKRWRSGLQVFQTEGITLPDEAMKKRADGRAPIPLPDGDVFTAIGEDRSVYAGPVPVKKFPLDLTLMLGRGSTDRHVVLIPLPAKNSWNTILYLDADSGSSPLFEAVDILARFALMRLRLIEAGVTASGGLVKTILNEELARRAARGKAPMPEVETTPEAPRMKRCATPPPVAAAPSVAQTSRVAPQKAVEQSIPSPPPAPIAEQAPATDTADSDWQASMDDAQKAEMQVAEQAIEDLYMAAVKPIPESGVGPQNSGTGPVSLSVIDPSLTAETILRHSGELPALPRAACHIMAVIDDPRTTAPKLEKAIALDQALTAKVLRIANSPFYGAVRDIKTVSEAIVRLGFVVIRNWALVTASKSVFLTPGSGLLFQKIWRQSVMTAMASQLVAQLVRHEEPDAVFLGGLMQNIGQLVLARAEPELFHQIVGESANSGQPYHMIERQLLGFDHGEIGALLMHEWNLSADLEDAVRYHHRLDELSGENRGAAMIALGEELAAVSSGGSDDEESFFENSGPAAYLGISGEQYGTLKAKAHQLIIDPKFFS